MNSGIIRNAWICDGSGADPYRADLQFENRKIKKIGEQLSANLPEINAEVIGLTTAWSLAREGVGATLLPWQFISHDLSRDNVDILDIRGLPYSRQPAIVYRKGQYLSEAAKFTMELLMQYNKG